MKALKELRRLLDDYERNPQACNAAIRNAGPGLLTIAEAAEVLRDILEEVGAELSDASCERLAPSVEAINAALAKLQESTH